MLTDIHTRLEATYIAKMPSRHRMYANFVHSANGKSILSCILLILAFTNYAVSRNSLNRQIGHIQRMNAPYLLDDTIEGSRYLQYDNWVNPIDGQLEYTRRTPGLGKLVVKRHLDHGLNKKSIETSKVPESDTIPLQEDAEPFSRVYEDPDTPFEEHHHQTRDAQANKNTNPQYDTANNLMELIESGSGAGQDNAVDDSPSINESILSPTKTLTETIVTPRFSANANDEGEISDHEPMLSKRLPPLIATAGVMWHFTIPADTFEDEDGSLRNLRTSLEPRTQMINDTDPDNSLHNSADPPFDNYMHWLQYDERSQTLIGLPMPSDVGRHFYDLLVTDRWGRSSNITIEIIVRQHPSIRSFSHSFTFTNIEWDISKYSSLTKALIEVAKKISIDIFSDSNNGKNFVVTGIKLPQTDASTRSISKVVSPISITWSNASMPVHPCNSKQLETILKYLVDDSSSMSNQLASQEGDEVGSFYPSQLLKKSLEPDFRLSRVDFKLQGSCKNAIMNAKSNESILESQEQDIPIIRTKIQKLQWRLGQPFAYRIPPGTFAPEDYLKKFPNLSISIHTIDGIVLDDDPHYSFIEFDPESLIIYGLPYDANLHSGQRELLLTVRQSDPSIRPVRDVIIIEILTPELTTINNRAFNMSLYFTPRTNLFSPQARVNLSHKIVQSIGAADIEDSPPVSDTGFIILEMKKFLINGPLHTVIDKTNLWAQNDRVRRIEDAEQKDVKDFYNPLESSILYKVTWTNETIGYRGDCPVEVITENIVGSLERNMFEYIPSEPEKFDDANKNDSVRFYERLRAYFEPEIDLIFLSIGPIENGACANVFGYYDVGNSDLADLINLVDFSSDGSNIQEAQDLLGVGHNTKQPESGNSPRMMINSDEYWSIVVLIILVVALIFVVMMFFMGMHTYRINQEKRFELQVKLAQARQNSMYLSSMMINDQLPTQDMVNNLGIRQQNVDQQICSGDGSSRKPVILDNEKQFWANGQTDMMMYTPTAVQLQGQTVQTTSLRPNMTFTLDSIASFQNPLHAQPVIDLNMTNHNNFNDRKRSMTLNRRSNGSQQSLAMTRQASMNQLNHSQSILTVASSNGPVHFMPHKGIPNMPILYAPLPIVCESNELTVREN